MGKLWNLVREEFDEDIEIESWLLMSRLEELLDEASKEFPYSPNKSEKDIMIDRHLWFCKWFGNNR